MPAAARILVALLVLLGIAVPTAAAQQSLSITQAIYADFALDDRIDQPWSTEQLKAALDAASGQGESFRKFQNAVGRAYDRSLLGLEDGVPSVPTSGPGTDLLPEPAPAGERERPPWPFIALSVLAGGLLLGGAGSSIYRRLVR